MNAQPYLLVVEDVPDILHLLDTTLRFKGYRVVTAHNGYEALDVIAKERPAMVITDILMPRLDGFNLVHRLRIDPNTRDLPVIFITATYVAAEDREFALNIGATRFIEKPLDIEQFLAMVAELLGQHTTVKYEPLYDFNFYEGYRKRLESKLDQKIAQIARTENQLETASPEEEPSLRGSLSRAISERDEIQLLLTQVHEQLKKYTKPS